MYFLIKGAVFICRLHPIYDVCYNITDTVVYTVTLLTHKLISLFTGCEDFGTNYKSSL